MKPKIGTQTGRSEQPINAHRQKRTSDLNAQLAGIDFPKDSHQSAATTPKMVLEAIRYNDGQLQILNQLKLPHQVEFDEIHSAEDGWHAIKDMRTRGAPAIAIVAALSLAVELQHRKLSDKAEEVVAFVLEKLDYLVTSRPTAVNLADAARKLRRLVENAVGKDGADGAAVSKAYCDAAAQMLIDDVSDNEGIGKYGAEWIVKHAKGDTVSVLTHCNTG